MAEVTASSGDSLALGLGTATTVLSWVAASAEPPYFSSLGDETADGVLVFRYEGSWSEYPASSAISAEEGRQTVREFLLGTRLASQAWTEVYGAKGEVSGLEDGCRKGHRGEQDQCGADQRQSSNHAHGGDQCRR